MEGADEVVDDTDVDVDTVDVDNDVNDEKWRFFGNSQSEKNLNSDRPKEKVDLESSF